jgi:hypothetical protein
LNEPLEDDDEVAFERANRGTCCLHSAIANDGNPPKSSIVQHRDLTVSLAGQERTEEGCLWARGQGAIV